MLPQQHTNQYVCSDSQKSRTDICNGWDHGMGGCESGFTVYSERTLLNEEKVSFVVL
jgi:hypothetical protein